MPLLSNVAICVWMVVMSQITCRRRRYFIDLDDLSKINFTFLFCCSRTEHKSMISCCNVGRDSALYLRVLDVTCYRPSSNAIDGTRAV